MSEDQSLEATVPVAGVKNASRESLLQALSQAALEAWCLRADYDPTDVDAPHVQAFFAGFDASVTSKRELRPGFDNDEPYSTLEPGDVPGQPADPASAIALLARRAKKLSECLSHQLESDYPVTYERAYWLVCGFGDYRELLERAMSSEREEQHPDPAGRASDLSLNHAGLSEKSEPLVEADLAAIADFLWRVDTLFHSRSDLECGELCLAYDVALGWGPDATDWEDRKTPALEAFHRLFTRATLSPPRSSP